MPVGGIYRAGRWGDAELYPAPSSTTDMRVPLLDGARWEDAAGGFSTIKCSGSAEAAIGRTIARYRRRVIDDRGRGILDAIKTYLEGPPDPGEPELFEGRIPPDIFDDLYLLSVPKREDLLFIDLMAPETLEELDKEVGASIRAATGADFPGTDLARHPDRRVTRLLLTILHRQFASGHICGIRYPGNPDPNWEAFVVWAPPVSISLTEQDVGFRWVARWDADLVEAANSLQLRIP
jgi:hypothetical protein